MWPVWPDVKIAISMNINQITALCQIIQDRSSRYHTHYDITNMFSIPVLSLILSTYISTAEAGPGGYYYLINGTPYNWKLHSTDTQRMHWHCPEDINPGKYIHHCWWQHANNAMQSPRCRNTSNSSTTAVTAIASMRSRVSISRSSFTCRPERILSGSMSRIWNP